MPINQLNIGDQVLAYNESTESNGYYPITAVHRHMDGRITTLKLQTGNQTETITTTPEHPFYVTVKAGNGLRPRPVGHEDLNERWVGAGHLVTGDKLKLADGGREGSVVNVTTQAKTQEMFNLTVAEAHTFYVGNNGWLVHNISCKVGDKLISTIEEPAAQKFIDKSSENMKIAIENAMGLLITGQPGLKQHALTKDRRGWFAIDVRGSGNGRGKLRMIYKFQHNGQDVPSYDQATSVFISEIIDYH